MEGMISLQNFFFYIEDVNAGLERLQFSMSPKSSKVFCRLFVLCLRKKLWQDCNWLHCKKKVAEKNAHWL